MPTKAIATMHTKTPTIDRMVIDSPIPVGQVIREHGADTANFRKSAVCL